VRNATAALLSAALLACTAVATQQPAAVRVDVVRAPPAVLDWDPAVPPPIHVLVDVTSSMQTASTEGVTHLRAARHAAGRFLRSLSPDADVTLHVLGAAIGSTCTHAVPVKAPPDSPAGVGLARIAGALPSRSEGSLAGALEAIARRIRSEEKERVGVRVLAISDLDGSCGERDLCDAAAALSSAGADLDLVVMGEAPVPVCLERIGGDQEPPLLAASPIPPNRAAFRVTREEEPGQAPPPAVGMVGGAALKVAPGRVRIRVDLDPPVDVGPVELAPNASLRIRILEVSAGEPQRWQVFVDAAVVKGDEGLAP
jgi:hypothetical protein